MKDEFLKATQDFAASGSDEACFTYYDSNLGKVVEFQVWDMIRQYAK